MPKHCQAKAPQDRLKQSTVTASLEKKERKENKKTEALADLFLSRSSVCVFVSLPFVCRRQTSFFFKGRGKSKEQTLQ